MVNILLPALMALAWVTSVMALPADITEGVTVPLAEMGLEPRHHQFCVDCLRLCHFPKSYNEGSACGHICAWNDKDSRECLNHSQRFKLALAMFPDDATYINTLGNHEIKDYLVENLDPAIISKGMEKRAPVDPDYDSDYATSDSDSGGSDIDTDQLTDDEYDPILEKRAVKWTCHVKINCKRVCDQNDDLFNFEGCRSVCRKSPDDCREDLNKWQLMALLSAYYPDQDRTLWAECVRTKKPSKCFEMAIFTTYPRLKGDKHCGIN